MTRICRYRMEGQCTSISTLRVRVGGRTRSTDATCRGSVAELPPITRSATTSAAQLGETAAGPRNQIWCSMRTIGPEQPHVFVAHACAVDAHGGMLVPDGSRKRTLDGSFFYLVRTHIADEALRTLTGRGAGNTRRSATLL